MMPSTLSRTRLLPVLAMLLLVSVIASQSEALASPPVGDSNVVSSAVSAAVEDEDNAIASSISSIVG